MGLPGGMGGMVLMAGLPVSWKMTTGAVTVTVFSSPLAQHPFLQQSLQQESAAGPPPARAADHPDARSTIAAIHHNHRVIGRASFSSRPTGTGGGP
jgi:hypothetical protein